MKNRIVFIGSTLLALFLALAPAGSASTWYVDGLNGNDNNNCKTRRTACKTINHAISLASSGDTIGVGPATYTENLNIGLSLNIIGSGAPTTIIDGGQNGTVVTIGTSAPVTLSNLTIQNGSAQYYGGGIDSWAILTINNSTITANSAYYGGGGIQNDGTLTINDSVISENTLLYEYGSGGGILNWATLTVNRSTITANSGSDGGGIYGSSIIINSTISGNSATWGGGIEIPSGTATITNSTLSGNSATDGGGGIENYGTLAINNSTISANSSVASGGISQVTAYGGSVTFQNSIIANNAGGNCLSNPGGILSNGYNLSSDNTCNFTGPGDLNNTNPKLKPLGNYGGPTQTMALPGGSPAIDAGNPNGCTNGQGQLLTTDQRGAPRPGPHDHHGCDMGAFENQRY